MLDERDLQAIQSLIAANNEIILKQTKEMIEEAETRINKNTETKIKEAETRINKNTEAMMDQRFEAFETRINKNTDTKIREAETRIAKSAVALMDAEFKHNFNLLAENQQIILEKMIPNSRMEALEEEVKFLRVIVRTLADDINELKKAN